MCLRVSEVLGRPSSDVAAATTANARRFFRLDEVAAQLEQAANHPGAAVTATSGLLPSPPAPPSAAEEAEMTTAATTTTMSGRVTMVVGDCTEASAGNGNTGRRRRRNRIIAHGCNDVGRWGRGFVLAVTKAFGDAPQRRKQA